jgi:hypothetical protein
MSKIMMNVPDSSAVRIPLEVDGILSIQAAAGLTLEALCGRAWVTFAGERSDYLLNPGERLSLDGRGAAVAQALGKMELVVTHVNDDATERVSPDAAVSYRRDRALHLAPYVSMERTF